MNAASSVTPAPLAQPVASATAATGRTRLLVVALLLVGLVVAGQATGVAESLTVANLRAWMAAAGPWGIALFVAVFLLGDLCQIPGLLFVAVAVLTLGRLEGGVLGYLTALVSVAVSFTVVRTVGGRAMAELEWGWLQRVLARLDERPIRTVALLRSILCLAPVLSYTLALSNLRFRDYMLGSLLGLIPPVTLFVVFFDRALVWFGF